MYKAVIEGRSAQTFLALNSFENEADDQTSKVLLTVVYVYEKHHFVSHFVSHLVSHTCYLAAKKALIIA